MVISSPEEKSGGTGLIIDVIRDERRIHKTRKKCRLGHLLLHLDELKDTILHFLHSLEFGETHSALVGDVIDAAFGLSVLSASSTDLEVELTGNLLQLGSVGSELGQLDVDGGADGGAQVGGAEGEEAETVVVGEGNALLDLVGGCHETAIDLAKVATHLHGDDTKVILLIHPDEESLCVVVEDTAAGGPVAAGVGGLEEAVTFLEEEVIVDELLLNFLGHAGEGVISTLKFSLESGEGGGDLVFHLLVLGLGEAGVEGVALKGAAAADAGRDDEFVFGVHVDEGVQVTEVLCGVLVGLLEAHVVVFDDGVKEGSEEGVRLGIRGVDTNAGVKILHT